MKLSLAILSLFLWLGLGASAAAAYCPGSDESSPDYDPRFYSVSNEFARSEYVVVAQVTGITWLGEDGRPTTLRPPFMNGGDAPMGFDPYLGAYYDLAVTRALKGRPDGRLRLFSENTSSRFRLEPDGRYLLFIADDTFEMIGAKSTIDACGNSAPLGSAQDVLRVVERLFQRTSR